jgi:hypothetical protein
MSAELRSIEQKLTESIDWNLARIKFLARFLVALITVKTVCLTQIASVFAGEAQPASHYKRIQRFLRDFDLDFVVLARFVVALVQTMGGTAPFILALDRTNWKLGKTHINILMLAIVYQGVAFPVFWTLLDKRGNSHTSERKELLERFVATFGRDTLLYLCADREFGGKAWLGYLLETGIEFRLRIKNNTRVPKARGRVVAAKSLFRSCRVNEGRVLEQARPVWGRSVFLSGMRLCRGEFVIVVSSRYSASALSEYGKRWGIETLFGCLKRRGFCLEATHVTRAERLSKLLALLCLAFCWAFAAGEWLSCEKPLQVKRHGRAAISLFRRGFDWLRRTWCALPGRHSQADRLRTAEFLSCT